MTGAVSTPRMGADVLAAQLSVVAIPAATTADRLLRSRPASHRLVRYCQYGRTVALTCGNRESLYPWCSSTHFRHPCACLAQASTLLHPGRSMTAS